MDLHHGVEALLARGPVAGEGLHSILLHFANPSLGIAVHLMEDLPQLALADVLRRVPETVDGVHQGAEELVHLGENPSQFGFPQLLHCAQHVLQLTAPQQFGLVLQRRNFGHDVGNGLLDIVEPASRRELIGSRREGIAAGSVEGGDPEASATLHSPPCAPSPHSNSAGNEAAEESGDGGLPAAIGSRYGNLQGDIGSLWDAEALSSGCRLRRSRGCTACRGQKASRACGRKGRRCGGDRSSRRQNGPEREGGPRHWPPAEQRRGARPKPKASRPDDVLADPVPSSRLGS
mmetsp:Transcript_20527/g.52348  ORF Transcript_20527/g.52348 Transcript_20527/m.52348 type:complete len:290 (+) Transcript_20527:1536-2405(+)